MSKKVILYIFLFIVLVIGILYWKLGGLAEASLTLTENESFMIMGKVYRGNPGDKELQLLMKEMEIRFRDGELPGTFAICYFGNPDKEESLEVLVGCLTDTLAPLPQGLITQTFNFPQAIRATLQAHVTVAPSPEKVNNMIQDFAQINRLRPTGTFIENYRSEDEIVTIVPVQPIK